LLDRNADFVFVLSFPPILLHSRQTKRLNVYPAARTLKGEPLSVPGNTVARPPPQEKPKPVSPATSRKSRPRPPRKSPSVKPVPKPVQKKETPIEPTSEPQVQSVTLIVDDELRDLQESKQILVETKELLTRELREIEKQSLLAQQLAEEGDEEDSEDESEDEEGESREEDSEDEEELAIA